MPKMGESIAEATITKWLKNEGDRVEKDEPLVEIATDKVDSEIPSSEEGILSKILFQEGDVVPVGEVVAYLDGEGNAAESNISATPVKEAIAVTETAKVEAIINSKPEAVTNSGDRFYSPLVMNIARTEGIGMAELETVAGTGKEGRVTKGDILKYVEGRSAAAPSAEPVVSIPSEQKTDAPKIHKPAIPLNAGDEVVEMGRVRKLIADHMVMSKTVSPHVTSFVEADVTELFLWREKIKHDFKAREGQNITFTPIFIEAVTKAIKDFPMINVSVDGDKIIKRKNINVGMAVAQSNGNLIVPVVKNADNMNLIGLTRTVNDLAVRARDNKLSPDEIQGGTYTLTNVGGFGNVMGTPVINQPQVAIMAVGAIRKKPAVLETKHGDVIAIRYMMYLSHSYDHRVVDGALGGMFVRRVADYLEQWDTERIL